MYLLFEYFAIPKIENITFCSKMDPVPEVVEDIRGRKDFPAWNPISDPRQHAQYGNRISQSGKWVEPPHRQLTLWICNACGVSNVREDVRDWTCKRLI